MPVSGGGTGQYSSGTLWRAGGPSRPTTVNQTAQHTAGGSAADINPVNTHAFRYYRLYVTATPNGAGVGIAELQAAEYNGGPDTTAGQTYTSSTNFAGLPASQAFDDTFSEGSSWASDFVAALPQWIKWDYGATAGNWKAINELKITARSSYDQAPGAFILQGSDDDSTWYDLLSQGSETFRALETKTYQATANGPSSNNISGTSSLTFAPSATLTGLGTLGGSSVLTFANSGTLTGLGTVAGSSSLVLSPSGTVTGKAALSGSSALVFTPSATATGLGGLTGSSALTFAQTATATGLGSLAGSSSVTFAPSGTNTGIGTLAGTTSLSFTGSGTLTGRGQLLGSTALSFGISGTLGTPATNELTGSATLSFGSTGMLQGIGQLQGTTQFSLTVSGVLIAGGSRFVPSPRPANANLTIPAPPSETNVIGVVSPGRVPVTTVSAASGTFVPSAKPPRAQWRT